MSTRGKELDLESRLHELREQLGEDWIPKMSRDTEGLVRVMTQGLLNGEVPFVAFMAGVTARPTGHGPNIWSLFPPKNYVQQGFLFLWVRPWRKGTDPAKYKGHVFKKMEGGRSAASYHRGIIAKGTLTECVKVARHIFDVVEPAVRLGAAAPLEAL